MKRMTRLLRMGMVVLSLGMLTSVAHAVPSFARQTGMSCNACHTVFPELTSFGRNFKLNGYTLAGTKQVQSAQSTDNGGLKINELPPLSMMLQIGYTQASKTDGTVQNSSVAFPQELSVFYAGEISPQMGTFLQMTYEQASDKLSWDNADIRFHEHTDLGGKPLTYGITLNNSPTVQDLWNSTPVWGTPYVGSGAAKTPANGAHLLEGGMAQDVAGLGAYGMWDKQFYAELTLYRSAHLGSDQPTSDPTVTINTIKGVAPYWRFAWENNDAERSFMVGLFGMRASIYDTGINVPEDRYNDVGIDTQYQGKLGANAVSAHASYITEKRTLAADGTTPKLNSLKLDGSYFWTSHMVGTMGYFNITGDDNAVWGTASNKPDSDGWTAEVSYLPWQNTKFTAQYRVYGKFDGTSTAAGNNNVLYLNAWFVW
jgi:hypothetical protein